MRFELWRLAGLWSFVTEVVHLPKVAAKSLAAQLVS
jgi:hypothetical protein